MGYSILSDRVGWKVKHYDEFLFTVLNQKVWNTHSSDWTNILVFLKNNKLAIIGKTSSKFNAFYLFLPPTSFHLCTFYSIWKLETCSARKYQTLLKILDSKNIFSFFRNDSASWDYTVTSRGTPTVISVSSWASSLSSSIKKNSVRMWPTIISLLSTLQPLNMVGVMFLMSLQWPLVSAGMTLVGVSLLVRAMVSGSAAPRHMGRWPGKGGDRRLFNCFVLSLYILYSSRFLVLVLLANCIQNMLASCPLVCDIENVKKSPCRDVRDSCEDIPPPGIIRHSIRFLHSLTAKLAILRAQQTVMCSALSLPISQTTNYIIKLYYVVSDLCLHLEKWEGDSWMYQQRPGRDSRGCWALDPGEVSDNLFKSFKSGI